MTITFPVIQKQISIQLSNYTEDLCPTTQSKSTSKGEFSAPTGFQKSHLVRSSMEVEITDQNIVGF